jgi:general secretion pathway protein G
MRVRGFSLIEMLVAVAIFAVLAAMAFPVMETVRVRQKESELRHALWEIRDAIDRYKRAVDEGNIERKMGQSGYPNTLKDLETGVSDLRDPNRRKLYFLRKVPRDPFLEQSGEPVWGLRSYASSSQDPRPGEDVFDVYSTSSAAGLNGLAYRLW